MRTASGSFEISASPGPALSKTPSSSSLMPRPPVSCTVTSRPSFASRHTTPSSSSFTTTPSLVSLSALADSSTSAQMQNSPKNNSKPEMSWNYREHPPLHPKTTPPSPSSWKPSTPPKTSRRRATSRFVSSAAASPLPSTRSSNSGLASASTLKKKRWNRGQNHRRNESVRS